MNKQKTVRQSKDTGLIQNNRINMKVKGKNLAAVEKYDERNFGGNTYEYAMMLCLDTVVKM